jgi:DNA-binding NtrC family response regulator
MPPDEAAGEAIIGKSKPMQEVYKAIGRVAPTDATVLLRGESGAGKELVARAIYQHSLRAEEISQAIGAESAVKVAQEKDAVSAIRQWIRQDLLAKAEDNLFDAFMDRCASLIIQEALDLTRGNRSQAARLLGLSRPTLQAKIDKYRLKVETSVKSEDA